MKRTATHTPGLATAISQIAAYCFLFVFGVTVSNAQTPVPGQADTGVQSPEVPRGEQKKRRSPFSHRIDFYGVACDERGKPVAGAQVVYKAPSGLIAALKDREKDGGVTGSDGRFAILDQKGGGISVWVRHPDYDAVDPLPVGAIYDDPSPTTPDKPAVFILKKKSSVPGSGLKVK